MVMRSPCAGVALDFRYGKLSTVVVIGVCVSEKEGDLAVYLKTIQNRES
jgi:hypothetical protein